jgi:hypothetical protein
MADPLTDVQNAIWTVLNASDDFRTLVPDTMQENLYGEGNRIGTLTRKESASPVVRIEPTGGDHHPQIDSSSTMLTQSWLIQVRVKDERSSVDGTTGLLPTKWAILRALSQEFRSAGTIRALTFGSASYVKDCRLMEHKDTASGGENQPGRWASVWRFEVDMVFQTTGLAPT